MQKAYARINWENYPSEGTPINERNLNKMDAAMEEIDNRVVSMDTTKLDKTTAASMVKDVSFIEKTGIFTVTYLNGATVALDTKLERLAINWSYDAEEQQLVITLDDGTTQTVDLSALITEYEFFDTDTIAFSVGTNGEVSATVKSGSITEDMIEPNYLANVKVEAAKAEAGAVSAENSATEAKSYTHGGTGIRENEDIDNAEYYYHQARLISEGLNGALLPMGTITFDVLENQTKQTGYMYNVSDAFTTTDAFKEGAGYAYPAGTNVYWTADGYWDCLAGTMVASVNGRKGDVKLGAEDVGLDNVDNTADADKSVKYATSAASATAAGKLITPVTFATNLASTGTVSFDGSANVKVPVSGTLPPSNGGTGKTTLVDSANALINALPTGASVPTDNDYFVSQYASGGTTTTTYHRRPVSALWSYIKDKISAAALIVGGNLTVKHSAVEVDVIVDATNRKGGMEATSTTKRFGLWDFTNSNWVMYSEPNQDVYIPHPLYVNSKKVCTEDGSLIKTKNVNVKSDVSANSSNVLLATVPQISGYTPLGVIDVEVTYPNTITIPYHALKNSSANIEYRIVSTYGATLTNTTTFKVLYVKNGCYSAA